MRKSSPYETFCKINFPTLWNSPTATGPIPWRHFSSTTEEVIVSILRLRLPHFCGPSTFRAGWWVVIKVAYGMRTRALWSLPENTLTSGWSGLSREVGWRADDATPMQALQAPSYLSGITKFYEQLNRAWDEYVVEFGLRAI